MTKLENTKILLGISGGIAAYKAAELTRLLSKQGAEIRVCMTQSAQAFIQPMTFQALSGNPVSTALLDPQAEAAMGHIELARWADHIIIAPATANIMAKLAHGFANDLLTTLCLATQAPISLAPAMNQFMWSNAATQDNLALLAKRNIQFFMPDSGSQACGEVGVGRMMEPAAIVEQFTGQLTEQRTQPLSNVDQTDAQVTKPRTSTMNDSPNDTKPAKDAPLNTSTDANTTHKAGHTLSTSQPPALPTNTAKQVAAVSPSPSTSNPVPNLTPSTLSMNTSNTAQTADLRGINILITAGPTREAIDPVRFISNRSSGKMGYAIAMAARELGATVTLVSGPTNLAPPEGVSMIDIESVDEMLKACEALAQHHQIFIATAAVADYAPAKVEAAKIKKSADSMTLELVRNPDILATISHEHPSLFTVGFAAETHNVEQYARQKLERKQLNLIAANRVGHQEGFDVDVNQLELIWANGQTSLPLTDKRTLGKQLMAHIITHFREFKKGIQLA